MNKSRILSAVTVLLILMTASVNASYVYSYTGNNFNNFSSPSSWDLSMNVSGTFELQDALGNNLTGSQITPASFSFTDGVNTITDADVAGNPLLYNVEFTLHTDSNGVITTWSIYLDSGPVSTPFYPGSLGHVGDNLIRIHTTGGLLATAWDTGLVFTCTAINPDGSCSTSTDYGDVTFSPGSWTVSSVPLPPAFWLFVTGLLGLLRVARTRINSQGPGMLSRIFWLAPVLMASSIAGASLVDRGVYVTDTASGLDWLKLTQTYNRSYDDVSSQFGASGEFEGWTYATGAQFEMLVLNQGGVPMTCTNGTLFCGWSSGNNGIAAPLINLLGDTGEQQLYGEQTSYRTVWTVGILADSYDVNSQWEAELYDDPNNLFSAAEDNISTHDTFINKASAPGYGGSFLVRATTVPVPGALWLFASGLFGLAGLSRRKKAV